MTSVGFGSYVLHMSIVAFVGWCFRFQAKDKSLRKLSDATVSVELSFVQWPEACLRPDTRGSDVMWMPWCDMTFMPRCSSLKSLSCCGEEYGFLAVVADVALVLPFT